jgi:arginase
MAERRFAIIEAPSFLGLRPSGVEDLPAALLEAGLAERLDAKRAARLSAPPYDAVRAPQTRVLNPRGIRDFAIRLANAVGPVIDRGEFPIVLGGDCSILLGPLLALQRRGRYGLFFLDGHADFYQPEAEPLGEAASMDLALATGRGPAMLTGIEGKSPLVQDEDVVLLAYRDAEHAQAHGSQPVPDTIRAIDLAAARRGHGVGANSAAALRALARDDLAGFWIHLDADVLDDAIMPAVDYRMPDGLTWDELAASLRAALATGRAIGLEVTIYNPRLDPDRSIARAFVDSLVRGLRG